MRGLAVSAAVLSGLAVAKVDIDTATFEVSRILNLHVFASTDNPLTAHQHLRRLPRAVHF